MTTTPADRAFLDTNVLLAATDTARAERDRAIEVLDGWPARGATLYTSGQVLREYVTVATRPAAANGLGLLMPDALHNVGALQGRLRFLEETEAVWRRLADLLVAGDTRGKQVHDANVVATMLAHGVRTLVTLNGRHFARFDNQVDVRAP